MHGSKVRSTDQVHFRFNSLDEGLGSLLFSGVGGWVGTVEELITKLSKILTKLMLSLAIRSLHSR